MTDLLNLIDDFDDDNNSYNEEDDVVFVDYDDDDDDDNIDKRATTTNTNNNENLDEIKQRKQRHSRIPAALVELECNTKQSNMYSSNSENNNRTNVRDLSKCANSNGTVNLNKQKRKLEQQQQQQHLQDSIKKKYRVILLLDLDCFYAQCECVRLGFNVITTSLALVQWSTTLAVTYPARSKFSIKRGDTYDDITKKVEIYNNNNKVSNSNDPNGTNNETNCQTVVSTDTTTTSSCTNDNNPSIVTDDDPVIQSNVIKEDCYTVSVPIFSPPKQTHDKQPAIDSNSTKVNNSQTIDQKEEDFDKNYNDNDAEDVENDDDVTNEYERIFCLTSEQQMIARDTDLGKRCKSTEGKASIERYRVASRKIFETVFEYLNETYPNKKSSKIELERASIDEFFIDITNVCYDYDDSQIDCNSCNNDNNYETNTQQHESRSYDNAIQQAYANTKIVGPGTDNNHYEEEDDDDDDEDMVLSKKALKVGCYVAQMIRQRIFDKLGFTLSAGISYNKTFAKLSTKYGKPNGQAITFPGTGTNYLLNNTEIRSCRNLGGKIGKKVITILPPNVPTTIGSIAKYLSLPMLLQTFPMSSSAISTSTTTNNSNNNNSIKNISMTTLNTAQWIYDLAHGIENEKVLSKNESAIPKSITCFKSLPWTKDGCNIEEVSYWIRLLGLELLQRVDNDTKRHSRHPKSCTVQYNLTKTVHSFKSLTSQRRALYRSEHSIRIPFPSYKLIESKTVTTTKRIDTLVESTINAIICKEGKDTHISRIGLCAIDFITHGTSHSTSGIGSYFSSVQVLTAADCSKKIKLMLPSSSTTGTGVVVVVPEVHNNKPQNENKILSSNTVSDAIQQSQSQQQQHIVSNSSCMDKDMELALKLQQDYDCEYRMLHSFDEKNNSTKQLSCQVSDTNSFNSKIPSTVIKVLDDSYDDNNSNSDALYAQKLQLSYDRENHLLSSFDNKTNNNTNNNQQRNGMLNNKTVVVQQQKKMIGVKSHRSPSTAATSSNKKNQMKHPSIDSYFSQTKKRKE